MKNDIIVFSFSYYIYTEAFPVITLDQITSHTEIMLIKIIENITFNKIIRKSSQESIDNFFKILKKVSKSRRKKLNKAKSKLIISNISQKKLLSIA